MNRKAIFDIWIPLRWMPLLFLIMTGPVRGQDMHFSQFYAAPLYLSPSLAGATDGARLAMTYRNQWPGITKAFSTSAVSFDNFFAPFNSGIGIQLIQDRAGSANLTFTHAALQYSYNVRLGDAWQFVPGIQLAYGSRALDFSKLIFGDEQIGSGASGSWDRLANENTEFIDFAASGLVYSPYFWAGLTIDHLAQPEHSFLGEGVQLNRKYVLFGGAISGPKSASALVWTGPSQPVSAFSARTATTSWMPVFTGSTVPLNWASGTVACRFSQKLTAVSITMPLSC